MIGRYFGFLRHRVKLHRRPGESCDVDTIVWASFGGLDRVAQSGFGGDFILA